MKKSLMDKWCEALESGEYEQGMGRLRTMDNKFCCLGVLCDVAGVDWVEAADTDGGPECYAVDGFDAFPGLGMMIEFGLSDDLGWQLAYRNDGNAIGHPSRVFTFAEQAAWIRENVPCESE